MGNRLEGSDQLVFSGNFQRVGLGVDMQLEVDIFDMGFYSQYNEIKTRQLKIN